MFQGSFEHAADSKGRVALPAKWRAAFGDRVVVSRGLDGRCLLVWRPEDWEGFVARELENLSYLSTKARAVNRHLRGSAHDVEIDAQGRILVPPALRKVSGIDGKVQFIGIGDRIEAWSPEAWAAYQEASAGTIEEIADRLWQERGV